MKFGVYYVIDNIVNKITINEEPTNKKNNSSIPNFIYSIAQKAFRLITKKGIYELDFAIEINRELIWFNGKFKKMSDLFKHDSSKSVIYKIDVIDGQKNCYKSL